MSQKNGAQASTGSACLVKSAHPQMMNRSPLTDSSVPVIAPPKETCYGVYDHDVVMGRTTIGPGVWRHRARHSAGGVEITHEWLCGPLYVDAITRSGGRTSDYGRLLRLRNSDT